MMKCKELQGEKLTLFLKDAALHDSASSQGRGNSGDACAFQKANQKFEKDNGQMVKNFQRFINKEK